MLAQSASIQAYFAPLPTPPSDPLEPWEYPSPPIDSCTAGDGFNEEEKRVTAQPALTPTHSWIPPQEYDDTNIADLVPGPGCRTFMGRIANLFDQPHTSKMPRAAKGCIKLLVKDDTGVRLWYARSPLPLRIGQLVTVWTPFVSSSEYGSLAPQTASVFTSIFPERDRGCHFMLHEQSDDGTLCKAPLKYISGRALDGLMTLQDFQNGGYDVAGGKLLLVVKWIAAKRRVTSKQGATNDLVRVGLFDHTAEATLTLWGAMCSSATAWKVSHTVLLIANLGWRIEAKTWLSITSNTVIDVDPDMQDTRWLRHFAERLKRREHVNPTFPENHFDFESLASSQLRIKYTLADLDEFARAGPSERFTGYMSLLLTDLNLVLLQRRNMLMCNECCGIAIYADSLSQTCKQCKETADLRLNPRVLGGLMDETGVMTCGQVIVHSRAWEQLFGRPIRDLLKLPTAALQNIEQRLLFARVTIIFGWVAEEVDSNTGRLCIWQVGS